MPDNPKIEIYPDLPTLSRKAVDYFIQIGTQSIAQKGNFLTAISGGSTPKELYTLLATSEYASKIDWSKTFIFFVDERCVLPTHPDSNYGMVKEILFSKVPIPSKNIDRISGEAPGRKGIAQLYEQDLRDIFETRDPAHQHLDLVLLGMGEDGHTASLFPHSPALKEHNRWVTENYSERLKSWRITMTPKVINDAENIIFLVSGESKAQTLQKVLKGSQNTDEYPAQLIQPTHGNLLWLLDQPATQSLSY
jgi:6-phosphogluconolactonase